ncbi:MAG: heme biosynthesis protein HemY [Hydrogenophilaceae bacterium]|nr:heme biosynthesis protein HemY [Hydrogenophilaceae bacterium]
MLRIAIILVVAVLAALAAINAANAPGRVVIEFGDYEIHTTALFALLALIFIVAISLPILRMLMFLMDAPDMLGRFGRRHRTRRGQEALALGLIAAESGEFDEARRHAARAEELIEEPRLAVLLQARAAEVAGDVPAAERAYSGMLSHEDTALLGHKGLLHAALKRGDRISAMSHAEQAMRLSKTAAWPFQSLFELKVQAADWEGALEALEQAEKRRLLEDKVVRRRRAVLYTAAAAKAERERRGEKAADLAQKAVRMAPGFAPAAALAARLLVAEGKHERAAAVLEDAWEVAPHPALAHAYRDLRVGESAAERGARMQALIQKRPDSRESRIVAAELAMERGDWGAAPAALDDAYREFPSARICMLYAQVARGRGDEAAARSWTNQAAAAPREPDWSDLDPEGPAFLYEDTDWARLVYVFGDSGQLIHPRMERGGRDATTGSLLALPPAAVAALPPGEASGASSDAA